MKTMTTMLSSTNSTIRTYSELSKLNDFESRFHYLQLHGTAGRETFGIDRYLNQRFYRSREWKSIRDFVIVRDNGCDLGIEGHEIYGKVLIHHMNPLSITDVLDVTEYLLNPEYLITVSHDTHNAIHYSDDRLLFSQPAVRTPNDTCPWKKGK